MTGTTTHVSEPTMCDYCGCRSHPAIEELSGEHETLLDILYDMQRETRRGSRDAVLGLVDDTLVPLLERHTHKEEQGLFRQLHDAAGRVEELVDEHRTVDTLVEAVRAAGPGWPQAVTRLAQALSEHIVAEEVDLFPYAMYELDGAAWAAVDAVHAAAQRV
jgi:hemerythrin-like domain-containing protein